MKFEFTAIPSGDCECFCWAVDRKTFIKLTGHKPDKYDKDKFNPGLYRVYPGTCFSDHAPLHITIDVERLRG